jgi:AraC family transcriptional regulator
MTNGSAHDIYLINQFPDFNAPGFDLQRYYSLFLENNVIINAQSSDVEYGDHWGPLSVKCAFRGKEFYHEGRKTVAVDDSSFLIFNEGKIYSSYIKSDSTVQSFTINFNPDFVREVIQSLLQRDLEVNAGVQRDLHFVERLYPHDNSITPLLLRLRRMSLSLHTNKQRVAELFCEVLEQLIGSQVEIEKEIGVMTPLRYSTKKELYQRLHNAKDHMDSCFADDLSLETIAQTAHLAPVYFLREFRKNFHLTPHQYLTQRRIEESKHLLVSGTHSVTEICFSVGFNDLSSFSKLFKARTGFPPERYRTIIRS